MKIIDAYWEKRNLGIDTKEIVVSASDSISDLIETIQSFSNISQLYIVVKIPTGIPEYIQFLIEQGFCFVESLFEVSLNVKSACVPDILKKFDSLLSYHQLNNETEMERLKNEIKKGIFVSDRIALNPQFGTKIAAVRYINWINDEIAKGAKVFEIIYKTTPIGFFALKRLAENEYDNFLGGMYVNQENFGYGFSILSKSIEEVKKQHGKSITTHISSNNIKVMRLYFQFGFVPTDIVYVMSKISKN
jgi:hypothetical protein